MKRKKRAIAAMLAACVLLVSACSITEREASETGGTAAGQAAGENSQSDSQSETAAESASQQWAKEHQLDTTQSSEELYQNALKTAGGEINIYTVSGRMENVKATFEEDYPGLTLVVHDLNINELLEKFTREYEAGIYTADVIHVKEQTGQILREFVETGMMHNYQPEYIFGEVD